MESNKIEECEKVLKSPDEIYKDRKMKDEFLEHLLATIKSKKSENPEKSYTAKLQQSDISETLKKIEEEAFEVIDAVKLKNKSNIVHEVADLWFHCLVLLAKKNLTVEDITNELKNRQGISGIEEKLNRVKK